MSAPKPQLKSDIGAFNPADLTLDNGNVFGLPFTCQDASVIVIPVPWEASVSYRAGTAEGPEAIRAASLQVDLYDEDMGDIWKYGIFMPPSPAVLLHRANGCRAGAEKILAALGRGQDARQLENLYSQVQAQFERLYADIEADVYHYLQAGKIVGLAGGDHSITLGALRACCRHAGPFGILHIDAHADLRDAYEGFRYSHASVMYNALGLPEVSRIVQVGVRDFCAEEAELQRSSGGRVRLFSDRALKQDMFSGGSWDALCADIVCCLPDTVYISFDIDGLDPALCPATGTPVPGGLSYGQALHLLKKVSVSGRKIIGFDLVEVAGRAGEDSWDAMVGARLLYQLSGRAILSCG